MLLESQFASNNAEQSLHPSILISNQEVTQAATEFSSLLSSEDFQVAAQRMLANKDTPLTRYSQELILALSAFINTAEASSKILAPELRDLHINTDDSIPQNYMRSPEQAVATAKSTTSSAALGTSTQRIENILIDMVIFFLAIYTSSTETLKGFIEKANAHKEAQNRLNTYARAFSALTDAMTAHPTSSLADLFKKACESTTTGDTTTLTNPTLYKQLEPFGRLLDHANTHFEYKPWGNQSAYSNDSINAALDDLFKQVNADIAIINGNNEMVLEFTNTSMTTEALREINKNIETTLVAATELSQKDAKYIETINTSMTLHMKAASNGVSALSQINNSIFR